MRILEVASSGTIGTIYMGPVSTCISELSNRFADRGHDVTIADLSCDTPRQLLHPRIRVVELSGTPGSRVETRTRWRISRFLRRWHNSYQYVRQLTSHIDLSSMDVVHLHAPMAAFLLQRIHGVQCFYTAHTPLWSLAQGIDLHRKNPGSDRARSLGTRFHEWVGREAVRRSTLTIGLGDYLAAAVPDANIVTIPNGLNLDAWAPLDRCSVRQALGIGERDFVVLFTGRITHVKGVDTLLEAVRSLAHVLPNLKVLIVGPLSGAFDTRDERTEPYAQAVMESSRGLPVRFLGFINNRDPLFKQYVAAADVTVVPSRREPQGLVVLESLAMGTPIIGSATGGIPDMVSPDVGYLFPPGDSAALAACIRDAYDNLHRLRAMSLVSRSRVQTHFSWEGVADRYLAAFARRIPV